MNPVHDRHAHAAELLRRTSGLPRAAAPHAGHRIP